MKKIVSFLLFCFVFSLKLNAATQTPDLKVKLVTLKTSLSLLKTKLTALSKKLNTLKGILTKPKSIKPTLEVLPNFEESTRDKYALYGDFTNISTTKPEGYGFKTANLKQLDTIASYVNSLKLPYKIDVPDFIGISSREVKNILNDMNIKIDQEWNKLVSDNSYSNDNLPENFSDKFMKKLSELANKIKEAFNNNASNAQTIFQQHLEPDNWNKLSKFITDNSDKHLMVRSTGREDTKELANAGGNESIANVAPTYKDIFLAMGQGVKADQLGVVSSYFGEKSMKQRLGAKDKHLFDTPLVPVLIQVMIGEKDGGEDESTPDKITRCGVLYTEETEGSLYKLTNGAKTSGITLIQASYGHNEGVVNSIIPVDSYYVDSKNRIYTIDRPKTFRLVPTTAAEKATEGTVKRKDHKDSKIIYRPALTESMIKSLKAVALATEQYYSMPMDLEFVIDVENKTINLVQARPIVIPTTAPASYLTNIDQYKDAANIDDIIVASGGALKFITSPDQILTEKGINLALNAYHSLGKETQGKVECIIIEENAPTTSHEAATFRGEGKPVIYIKNWNNLDQWLEELENGSGKFVIDLQQNKIVKWTEPETVISALVANKKANIGWISYPISKVVSLVPPLPKKWQEPAFWKNLLDKTFPQKTLRAKLDVVAAYYNTKQRVITQKDLDYKFFIDKIKSASSKEETLHVIIGLWILTAKQLSIIPKDLQKLYDSEIKFLLTFMQFYLYEIYLNWVSKNFNPANEESRLKLLFQINFLQAILYQSSTKDIVNGFSFGTIITKDEAERKLAEKEFASKGLATPATETVQLARLSKYALTDELKTKWLNFISDIKIKPNPNIKSGTLDGYAKISKIISETDKLGITELWFNAIFAEDPNPINNLDKLYSDFFDSTGNLKPLIQKLSKFKQAIDTLNLDGLASPSSFLKVWDDFQKNILIYFISDEFKNDFVTSTSQTEKLVSIIIMELLISKYDASIKAMENSKEFKIVDYPMTQNIKEIIESGDNQKICNTQIKEKQNKIFTFSFMLYYYFSMLKKWYQLLEEIYKKQNQFDQLSQKLSYQGEETLSQVLEWPKPKDLHSYVFPETLLNCSKETNNAMQLQSRKDFNVNMSIIGSKAKLSRAALTSLEEFFTFTHQSILIIIGNILANQWDQDTNLPGSIKKLIANIKLLKSYCLQEDSSLDVSNKSSTSILSKNLKNGILTIKYNYPQRVHSATIEIVYKIPETSKQNPLLQLTINIFGENFRGRFKHAVDVMEIFSSLYNLTPKQTTLETKNTKNEIECSWTINNAYQNNDTTINNIINCIKLLSQFCGNLGSTGTLLNVRYEDIPNLPSRDQVKDKILEISAQGNRSRICWPLCSVIFPKFDLDQIETALGDINKIQEFVPTPEQKKLLKTILNNLNSSTNYGPKSKAFCDLRNIENWKKDEIYNKLKMRIKDLTK